MNILTQPSPRRLVSWLTGAATACAVALCMAPTAQAQVDGNYQYLSTTGSLTIAGKTLSITSRQSFLTNPDGFIVIENSQLKISSKKSAAVIQTALTKLKLLSNITISATGPNAIAMNFVDRSYVGSLTTPIAINFSGMAGATKAKGRVKVNARAKVKNGNMTITVPIGGVFIKGDKRLPIEGLITIQGVRVP